MTHNILDTIGHIGYALILVGMIFINKKSSWGWFIRLWGEILWMGIGIYTGFSSMWIWGIVFCAMDIWGYFKWRKQEKEKNV